jgi:hypothetical protein
VLVIFYRIFNKNMAIETSSNRREEENKQLEKIEKNLKAKLGEQADTMHVKG